VSTEFTTMQITQVVEQ